jgi:transcriptional regulator with GAF, ATPase, and Fis domain
LGGGATIYADTTAVVLAEIADIASETLELDEVFDRVADSVRKLIPFHNIGVVRILDNERAMLHATTMDCGGKCPDPVPLEWWSPRWRPHLGPTRRIDDAAKQLDPSFQIDARALEGGLGSGLWAPFRRGNAFVGGVWLSSRAKHAFTDEHEELLRPVAAILGTAVEHWQIWDAERRRRERLDQVESLLQPLANSLEPGDIFEQLSSGLKAFLPHDLMALTELDMQARTIRLSAIAGEADIDPPPPTQLIPLTEEECARRVEFEILRDIPRELQGDTARERLIIATGMRSWVRVPLLLSGEVRGSLSLFSRRPAAYGMEDAEVVRRLADRIALVLSHRQLAEEARVAAETRQRAEQLEARVEALAAALEERARNRVVGQSPAWKDTLSQIGRVARSDTTVLITGESGTGKEVVSSLIHQGSARAKKPFVAINCAALPEQLLESELFGHEKGAFTGAIATKIGRIEQAEGGTLFLDEIAEMSPLVQAKFLRVLEEREFQRVGGSRTIQADLRVIAATNRDLAANIARGAFREDLYYRLNVFHIPIAPLRERREDILPLAEAFLQDLGKVMGRPAAGISRDAREWLLAHPWPGNVRELRNAIERAILLCDGGLITRDHLPKPMVLPDRPAPANGDVPVGVNGAAPAAGDVNLDAMERGMIERALLQSRGNKSRAARLLGLTRAQLYTRLEKHALND